MNLETTASPREQNRGPEILAICGSLVGVAVAVVSLRVWVRASLRKIMGWDDYFIIAAVTVMFVEMMIIIPEVQRGGGRHVQYIKPESDIPIGLHFNFITQPLCLIALCLTKVSVGLFLTRITPSTKFKYVILGVIMFTVLSSIGNLLTVFLQCKPLAFTWDSSVPGGECISPKHLKFAAFFNSSVSLLTDLAFALLPIPMIWKVQLSWRLKTAIAGVLSLGIFVSIAAAVKIAFLEDYGKHGDFLFDSSDLTIWTTVEICTAIVAACIPCLKPIFKNSFDQSNAESWRNSNRRSYIRSENTNNINRKSYKDQERTVTTQSLDDGSGRDLSAMGSEDGIALR